MTSRLPAIIIVSMGTLDILYRIALAALGIALAVLIISPIAAPVSDRYLFTCGIITLLLIIASAALWFRKRK